MNLADMIIMAFLIFGAVLAAGHIRKVKKNGGCLGGCSGCSGCAGCKEKCGIPKES